MFALSVVDSQDTLVIFVRAVLADILLVTLWSLAVHCGMSQKIFEIFGDIFVTGIEAARFVIFRLCFHQCRNFSVAICILSLTCGLRSFLFFLRGGAFARSLC